MSFWFWLFIHQVHADSCNLKALAHPPQIFVVGEQHYEAVNQIDAMNMDPRLLTNIKNSSAMRGRLFALARAGKFAFYSEVYETPDGQYKSPFFPEEKNLYDKGNGVYGLEAPELAALTSEYHSVREVYAFAKHPDLALQSIFKDSLRFDIDWTVWKDLLKKADRDPALQPIKLKIFQAVADLNRLRSDSAVSFAAQFNDGSGRAGEEIAHVMCPRFTPEETKILVAAHQRALLEAVNAKYHVAFKPFVEKDYDDGRLDNLSNEVYRFRDGIYANEAVRGLCDEAEKGTKIVVFNMGDAHMAKVLSEIAKQSGGKISPRAFKTVNPPELQALQTSLDPNPPALKVEVTP